MQIKEYMKKQPLFGLMLAVAGGLVLAHFAIKMLDAAYEQAERNPDEAVVFACAVAGAAFIAWCLRGKISKPNLKGAWGWLWRYYLVVAGVGVGAIIISGADDSVIALTLMFLAVPAAFCFVGYCLSPRKKLT